ncbi:TPA: hypothetical protein QDB26_005342 [Burkholderia vietnamiensis]|nr:hypothetical protein [Burkholderia vietnamiensis]HDR9216552.1 hypothetical protein [Burkholderia vietnamiensis]
MEITVQFSDSSETLIIAYFGSPQDPVDYPNQGTVDATDPRWTEYYNSTSPFLRGGMPSPPAG